MSFIRKDKMLDEMFKDIASPEEMLKAQELFDRGFKGSMVVYQTKRVLRQWNAMLGKDTKVEPINKVRTFTVNEGGSSRLVVAGR